MLVWCFASEVPWIWFSLLLLPLLGWFFETECSAHKSNLVRLIRDVCLTNKMLRIED